MLTVDGTGACHKSNSVFPASFCSCYSTLNNPDGVESSSADSTALVSLKTVEVQQDKHFRLLGKPTAVQLPFQRLSMWKHVSLIKLQWRGWKQAAAASYWDALMFKITVNPRIPYSSSGRYASMLERSTYPFPKMLDVCAEWDLFLIIKKGELAVPSFYHNMADCCYNTFAISDSFYFIF